MGAYDDSSWHECRKKTVCERCNLPIYRDDRYLAYKQAHCKSIRLCVSCAFAKGLTGHYYYFCKALEDELARQRLVKLERANERAHRAWAREAGAMIGELRTMRRVSE